MLKNRQCLIIDAIYVEIIVFISSDFEVIKKNLFLYSKMVNERKKLENYGVIRLLYHFL